MSLYCDSATTDSLGPALDLRDRPALAFAVAAEGEPSVGVCPKFADIPSLNGVGVRV